MGENSVLVMMWAKLMVRTMVHKRWRILALTVLSQTLLAVNLYSSTFWVVPWIQEFSASHARVMLTMTIYSVAGGLIYPVSGLLLNLYPARRLFLIGVACVATTFLIGSVAHSLFVIQILYGTLYPLGTSLCGSLACLTLVTRWFEDKRGLALGISATGVSIGTFITGPMISILLGWVGWRGAFQVLGIADLLLIAPAAWVILSCENTSPTQRPGGDSATRWTAGALLHCKDFWLIVVAFEAFLIADLPLSYSVAAFGQDLKIPQASVALSYSLYSLALFTGKISFGKLADSVSHRSLYWVAASVLSTGVAVTSLASGLPQFVFGLILAGLGMGGYLPLQSSIIFDRFGGHSFSRVVGFAGIFDLMSAFAPFLSGLVRDVTGTYSAALLLMLVPMPIAMIAMGWISRISNRKTISV